MSQEQAYIPSEAEVENKTIIPLLQKLSLINNENMYRLRVPVKMQDGREKKTKEADIVLYDSNNKPFVVVEAKKPSELLDDDAINQLDSYAFWLECPYGIACNGKTFVVRAYMAGNERRFIIRSSVDRIKAENLSFIKDGERIQRESQISASLISEQSDSFSSMLKDIHQDIRDTDKLDPTGAFDGWSKLLFMKIYEEKWSKENDGIKRFDYKKFKEECKVKRGNTFIDSTFKTTCNEFPNIFEKDEKLGLSLEAIDKILKRLDGYNILEIPIDVKGKAYETFLSSTFRGKGLGQFFTPRPVVDFMVNMVNINLNTKVLDPACGTGGFLIKSFLRMREMIKEAPDNYFSRYEKTKESFLQDIKDNQIFGIDGEPRATKTAKMNMIMWGDGENVVRGNGLDDKDIMGEDYPFNKGDINLILANPPFGSKETKDTVLANYTLYKNNNITKTECLFIERAINTLAPDGELCIVIPDSILGSTSMKAVRKLIFNNAQVVAVISLPQHTFTPSGVQTINSSVLYIRKYKKEYFDKRESSLLKDDEAFIKQLKQQYGYNEYKIFMGVAKEIGYEPNGKPTRNKKNDLSDILNDYNIARENHFYKDEMYHKMNGNSFTISLSSIEDRLDARYHWFMKVLSEKTFEKVPLENYITIKSKKINPKDTPDETFSIISVTNRYGVILDEDDPKKFEVKGEDFSQSYKKVEKNDIVYNPYRINVGSIGIVDKEFDDYLVSPAYVVFQTKNGLDKKVLTALFKHPFYKLYIDVLATGSIRNNFGGNYLKTLLIPKQIIEGNTKEVLKDYEEIDKLNNKIRKRQEKMINNVGKFL